MKNKKEELTTEAEAGSLNLSLLAPSPNSRKRRKRLGKGEGSGKGKTCGKGGKGQSARSGYKWVRGFEGGQMPIHRRLPKVGFTSRKKTSGENLFSIISLQQLSQAGLTGEVTLQRLTEAGLVKGKNRRIKILGGGDAPKSITIEAHASSQSARAAIEQAGGSLRIIS